MCSIKSSIDWGAMVYGLYTDALCKTAETALAKISVDSDDEQFIVQAGLSNPFHIRRTFCQRVLRPINFLAILIDSYVYFIVFFEKVLK